MARPLTTLRDMLGTIAQSYVTIVVVALLVGAAFAPIAWGTTSGPDGTVAVIELNSGINERVADEVIDDLREARENESINAVVLEVDSPGGGVTASESLYLAVERTAEEMPVVTSIQSVGASGGYYMSVPSDEIYVNPSSTVGSVGVRATYIDPPTRDEQITTGPDKAGGTKEQVKQQVEQMKQMFVGSVMEHRGDELELSETELSYAKTYTGVESVENGLTDEVGDTEVAIGAAADMAGLNDYETVEMDRDAMVSPLLGMESTADDSERGPDGHPQTYGDYGSVNTPAFLAVWGTVDGETVIETSRPSETPAPTTPATGGEAP
ncbi:S49 family peptidase [Halopiger djelfimassiliensis]|uniref:S49 family peptidase n=1 Tax=Halopiger djelfimassiliensis TaxID=1293047 RepID=UPI000677A49E|nr:S49 family peptidase [Halopiger djelfimassiliensis]